MDLDVNPVSPPSIVNVFGCRIKRVKEGQEVKENNSARIETPCEGTPPECDSVPEESSKASIPLVTPEIDDSESILIDEKLVRLAREEEEPNCQKRTYQCGNLCLSQRNLAKP